MLQFRVSSGQLIFSFVGSRVCLFQGATIIFHVTGSMVPSGQCDFTLVSDTAQLTNNSAAPVVALPGARVVAQPPVLPLPVMPQQQQQSSSSSVVPDALSPEQEAAGPVSLLSGMGVTRKPLMPQIQGVTVASNLANRPGSPARPREASPPPTAIPAVRMSTPNLPSSSSVLGETRVKRRTVMTLYRQLRDQLDAEEHGERMPKFHGDMPSTLNVIASGIRSSRKSLNIAGRPFRGRTSNELLGLARQLESKPLNSSSLRPLPSRIHLMVDLKSLSIAAPAGTDEVELQWNVCTANGAEFPLYDPIRMALGSDGRLLATARTPRIVFSNLPMPPSEAVIVCKVHRVGWLETSPADLAGKRESFIREKIALCRRPVGTAVLELSQLTEQILAEGVESIQTMWIYTAHDENLSSGLHTLLVKKIKQGYEDMKLLPASKGILVGVSLLSDAQMKTHLDCGVPTSQTKQIPLGFKETPRNDLCTLLFRPFTPKALADSCPG